MSRRCKCNTTTSVLSSDKTTDSRFVVFFRLKSLESSPLLRNTNVHMYLYHNYFTIFASVL